MKDTQAAQAFAALGNEHRVAVLRLLVRAGLNGLNVTSLRDQLDLPATTLGHHLKTLVEAGLVEQEKIGRELISRPAYGKILGLSEFLLKDCCRDAPELYK